MLYSVVIDGERNGKRSKWCYELHHNTSTKCYELCDCLGSHMAYMTRADWMNVRKRCWHNGEFLPTDEVLEYIRKELS